MLQKVRAEYARRLRQRKSRTGRSWHVGEAFIRIDRMIHLWRAVDQTGQVANILVQNRRERAAAKRFFRHSVKATLTN